MLGAVLMSLLVRVVTVTRRGLLVDGDSVVGLGFMLLICKHRRICHVSLVELIERYILKDYNM